MYWELAELKISGFLSQPFFKSSLWESVKNSWVARMGRNFDDYPGFQPKSTSAQKYATQSILISALQICTVSFLHWILPHSICYSHYTNGVCNGATSIAQWGLLSDYYKVNSIGQWKKILVIVIGFVNRFWHCSLDSQPVVAIYPLHLGKLRNASRAG